MRRREGAPTAWPSCRRPASAGAANARSVRAVAGKSPEMLCSCERRGKSPERQSRAGLCGEVMALRQQREVLREIAGRQREELGALDFAAKRLKAAAASDAACVTPRAPRAELAELERLRGQREHLERELAVFRARAATLRSAHKAEAKRAGWREEIQRMERALAGARAEKRALEAEAERQVRDLADVDSGRFRLGRLQGELAQERAHHAEAEAELRSVQAQLVSAHEASRTAHPGEARRLAAQQGRLEAATARLAGETETRQVGADELRDALEAVDQLHNELRDVVSDSERLRAGLRATLRSLEHIRQQCAGDTLPAAPPDSRPPDALTPDNPVFPPVQALTPRLPPDLRPPVPSSTGLG